MGRELGRVLLTVKVVLLCVKDWRTITTNKSPNILIRAVLEDFINPTLWTQGVK